ncbi:MAG: hypothetical protein AAGK14_08355 [Verrucomicrobiota bacterium]
MRPNNVSTLHPYLLVSTGLFTVVAFLHLLRLERQWDFQFGPIRIPPGVSLTALTVCTGLAAWSACLLLASKRG